MADNLICGRGVDKNRLAEVLRKEFENPVGPFKIEHRVFTRNNSYGKSFSERSSIFKAGDVRHIISLREAV
jgi:hypothetical protein